MSEEEGYSHQDWSTVIIGKPKTKVNSGYTPPKNDKTIDPDYNEDKIVKYPHKFIQEVIRRRNELKWKQKDLAHRMNVQPQVIQRFEQNKEIYNGQFFGKLKRLLKIEFDKSQS